MSTQCKRAQADGSIQSGGVVETVNLFPCRTRMWSAARYYALLCLLVTSIMPT